MADPETLAALKRAYADTILNMTKEAAARVLVSEKKARRYQQELVTVKDEALHTLVRLKHMYDSKVAETEMISLKQQQKVEELEAQLEEAEDIVGDLRMELRGLRDVIKKLMNDQTHHEEGSWVSSSHERSGDVGSCIPVEESGSLAANGIKNSSLMIRTNSMKQCSSKDKMDRCNHTLPSILIKRKEVERCSKSMANGEFSSSLAISGCADASDSISSAKDREDPMVSPETTQKDVGTTVSLETSSREHEKDGKLVVGETEASKEENVEVSASHLCEEAPALAVNKNRCIKYTFQRKRKKEVISNPEGDESRNLKQQIGDKDDNYLETLKPSFIGESARDSLCVAQVARQIVPFSEKTGLQAELVNQ